MDEQIIKAFEDKLNSLHGLRALLANSNVIRDSKLFGRYPIIPMLDTACNFLIANLVIVIEQLRKH